MRWSVGFLVLGLALAGCEPSRGKTPESVAPEPAEIAIAGTVVSDTGEPLEGVGVAVMRKGGGRATTDERGRFALSADLPDSVFLIAYDSKTKRVAATQVWIDEPTLDVHIRLGDGESGSITFPRDPFLQAQAEVYERDREWAAQYQAALSEAVDDPANRVLAVQAFDRAYLRAARREDLRARMEAADDPKLRRVLMLHFFAVPTTARGFGDAAPEPELATQLLESLPAESPLWAVAPVAMWNAVTETGDIAAWEAYLDQAVANAKDPFIPATILGQRFLDAWVAGDIEKAEALADRIRGLEPTARALASTELSNFEAAHGKLRIGATVGEFSWTSRAGKPISNESLSGGPFLLYFWAPWCGACKQDVPALKRLHADHGDRLRIVSVVITDPDEFATFEQKRGPLPWTHVIIPEDDAQPVHERFAGGRFPTWLLVDQSGTIVESSRNFPMSTPGHSRLYDHVVARLPAEDG